MRTLNFCYWILFVIENFSERHNRQLNNSGERTVRKPDGVILPQWVHPVLDKLIKNLFLADFDSFLLKLNRIPGEKLCEIKAAAMKHIKNVKQTPTDKRVEKPESIRWKTVFW